MASLLISFNHQIILNNNKISFLLCENNLIKFYRKFGWKKIPKKNFLLDDKKNHLNGMIFNCRKFNKKKKYIFYLLK